MEVVRQDDAFVRTVLERVLQLLYITLQDRASKMPLLHRELGLSEDHKVPVSHPPANLAQNESSTCKPCPGESSHANLAPASHVHAKACPLLSCGRTDMHSW